MSTGKAEDSMAAQALRRIAALYAIEKDIRGRPPDVRTAQRQARAGPLLEEMHAWLSSLVGRVSAKSDLARAIGYTLTRWQALTRYRDDGRIEIDNNAAERALRGVALGRGNYLFMGSDAGGARAAAIYSLVQTAQLNGTDPEAYLREVLGRIADHPIPSTVSTSCCHGTWPSAATSNHSAPPPGPPDPSIGAASATGPGVNPQTTDPRMLEALQDASSFELYQLKAIIEGLLADPRRGLAARTELHLGQSVRFVDFRDGQQRQGKVIALRDTQATVLEQGTKRTWKLPCVALQGATGSERDDAQGDYDPPPEPAAAASKAREFQRGDTVTFEDRDGRSITGVVVRINQRTATVGTGDGGSWQVPFHMLRHVLDV